MERSCCKALLIFVSALQKRLADKKSKDDTSIAVQADDLIVFRQFTKKTGGDTSDEVSIDEGSESCTARVADGPFFSTSWIFLVLLV